MNPDNPDTGISEYLDRKIYNGIYYHFKTTTAKDDGTISYLSAQVWDYYKDDATKALLQLLQMTLPD